MAKPILKTLKEWCRKNPDHPMYDEVKDVTRRFERGMGMTDDDEMLIASIINESEV